MGFSPFIIASLFWLMYWIAERLPSALLLIKLPNYVPRRVGTTSAAT